MSPRSTSRDRGAILPLVLIVVVVMALVIVALADYASTTLRFGQGVERSGDRLAAADAALDNTLEAIDRSASLCALTPLVNTGGYTFDLGHEINGIEPTITCRSIGPSPVTGVEEFALVLTSDADETTVQLGDALLNFVEGGTGSQRKVIDGPVYFARPPNPTPIIDSINLSDPLTVRNGDVWYTTDTDCIGPDPDLVIPSNLLVGSRGRDTRCLETDWNTLFDSAQPSEPLITSFLTAPAPDQTGICHVWEPGAYFLPPTLDPGSYNYFRSGDYYFSFSDIDDAKNVWNIGDAWVLFGRPGPAGPPIGSHLPTPAPDPHPCQSAWLADTGAPGATIYLGGRARMEVLVDGALTVVGRDQGGGRRVAVQAYETQDASTLLTDTPRLIKATAIDPNPQRGSKIAIQGLVWAPFNSLELGRVANRAAPALSGGAVIGELHLGARPDRVNHLVTAGTTPAPRRLQITVTAVSPEGGTTSIEAVIDYRDGDYGLVSRRVVCITPETSSC